MTPTLLFLFIALGLIATELLIMQFSVFWFLFFGIGALITSGICWLFPALDWTPAWGVFLLSSLVVSLLLFKPLKRWQAKPSPLPGHDAVGQKAEVTAAIAQGETGKVIWSGTEWAAQLADGEMPFAVGDKAVIRRLEGIRLIVGR